MRSESSVLFWHKSQIGAPYIPNRRRIDSGTNLTKFEGYNTRLSGHRSLLGHALVSTFYFILFYFRKALVSTGMYLTDTILVIVDIEIGLFSANLHDRIDQIFILLIYISFLPLEFNLQKLRFN